MIWLKLNIRELVTMILIPSLVVTLPNVVLQYSSF